MADGFDLFGDFEAPTLDTGMFDLGGGGADWTSQLGQPSFSLADVPTSPGNQDWMNSLGTGLGTYGQGVPRFNEFQNNLQTPTQPAEGGGVDWGSIGRGAAGGLGALGSVLGLGVSGLGMANAVRAMQQGGQQQKILKQAQEQAQQVAAPAAQAGANLTRAGEQAMLGGPLPGQMEQMVQKWRAESRARIQQYLAKSGISDSTMAQQFESWIDQNEGMYRQQLAQSLLQGGYTGISTATGPIGQSGQMAAGQMGGTDKFLREANSSLALLTGAQRGQV
jgi:hypothetical protein